MTERLVLRPDDGSASGAPSEPGARLEETCRIDVWLWRARIAKTRSLAAGLISERGVRLTRDGVERRVDKPSRSVRAGDRLVFAREGRLYALTILALGTRRGPAAEARALYRPLADPEAGL